MNEADETTSVLPLNENLEQSKESSTQHLEEEERVSVVSESTVNNPTEIPSSVKPSENQINVTTTKVEEGGQEESQRTDSQCPKISQMESCESEKVIIIKQQDKSPIDNNRDDNNDVAVEKLSENISLEKAFPCPPQQQDLETVDNISNSKNSNSETVLANDSISGAVESSDNNCQSEFKLIEKEGGDEKEVEKEKVEEEHQQLGGEEERPSGLDIEGPTQLATASGGSSPHQSVYHIKWIKWKDGKAPIITQNENGPCPLISIINVLILVGKIHFPSVMEMITADQLMEYLGDCMLDCAPKNVSESAQLNYEQNMHDAMAILPKLQTGLDVNVRFTGVRDFEYTPECIIFDLLDIPLYHGWLVDPQTADVGVLGKLGYNQLVEKIITNKSSSNSDLVTEALIAESFLERTASQLTYHGLCELNESTKPEELAILFRNNHFSTIFKHQNELFQLVTDQGFLTESNVVWETLSNIDGDGQFVDSNFVTVPPKATPSFVPPLHAPPDQQINQDYLVALSLQEEQEREIERQRKWEDYKQKHLGVTSTTADEELARKMQEDEEKRSAEAQNESGANRSQPESPAPKSPTRRKNDCRIL